MVFARDDGREGIGGDGVPQDEDTLTVAAQDVGCERDADGVGGWGSDVDWGWKWAGMDFTAWQKWHEETTASIALSVSKAKKYRLNSRLVWNLEG